MNATVLVPLDVKLMNLTASVLFVLLALGVLGGAALWASRHAGFSIRSIAVTGEVTHHNAVTLRANVLPHLSGTFLTLDLSAARQAFESLPWVRHAVVHRDFPNRLRVQLQEHQAVAYWGGEGESRLLNNLGEVFEANLGELEREDLPRLAGPDGQASLVLAMYQTLQAPFELMDLGLEQLELNPHGGWRARLDTGAELQLGSGAPLEVLARSQRFLQTLTQVTSRYGRKPEALQSADLRHQDGYAIRLRGVSTLAADPVKK
ncbi:MAG: cell division protein FtsQ/DivIB [Gammaproteobacteria bacterium]|uniref:cell division protein FtsQ/DivIB n=1 Tax=Rhodoferax sp. TaxID=50421 RepID=UPI0017AAD4F3|nr:cell division protein FtsQ/DivIB [Rhodoferax sp.]MBU3897714.1 cell division protein FtsQ/DivIB [Gammaproteobacteria bacterium]MBA3057805.1 FtsQ-type POTRA domain-containing protein [Rhodoferax sp.]MBU3998791.1 cell division protein FtsQ/DivIB [Gammaproteobacteria bacterium]MBU4081557.1 cell division protein FtsQ/DivIB [Gammaproteobacteria bacterium]MBU4114074.1 cell division protein FtsQ/DivIB [Gammaproteobacteria bacterium]